MVHKIAIGLAAAAIAMAGATSGTLAQGLAGGESGAKASVPAHGAAGGGEQKAEHKAPREAMGKAEQKVEHKPEQKVEHKPEQKVEHKPEHKPEQKVMGRAPHEENVREKLRSEATPKEAVKGGNRQVQERIGGRETRHEVHVHHHHGAREVAREERGRGGGRVNIHLGGHPGFGPSFHRGLAEHHRYAFGGPSLHRGVVVHRFSRPSLRRGGRAYGQQRVKIKIGGGQKRGGVTLRVR
jgi:hypothetical protein